MLKSRYIICNKDFKLLHYKIMLVFQVQEGPKKICDYIVLVLEIHHVLKVVPTQINNAQGRVQLA